MLGAIIGDIVGSIYEFDNIRTKDFEFFQKEMFVTDDTVMTLAVGEALLDTMESGEDKNVISLYKNLRRDASEASLKNFREKFGSLDMGYKMTELSINAVLNMVEMGRKYPYMSYGNRFRYWLEEPIAYNSFGNGAAMRISPVAYIARDLSEVSHLSKIVTEVSHDHKDGIKGAEATASAIFLARNKASKEEIKSYVEKFYELDFGIEDLRENYQFNETCQETVPQAIFCFLESNDFEDAIRNAISIGGDSDTLAAITGAIAEAYYGIPDEIRKKALTYLDEDQRNIFDRFETFVATKDERKYLSFVVSPSFMSPRIYAYEDGISKVNLNFEKEYKIGDVDKKLKKFLEKWNVKDWKSKVENQNIIDGINWELNISTNGRTIHKYSGQNYFYGDENSLKGKILSKFQDRYPNTLLLKFEEELREILESGEEYEKN